MDELPSLPALGRQTRPLDEFVEAVRCLRPLDLRRLRRIGDVWALGNSMRGEDLMQEAMARVLDGSRPWPEGVSLFAFLNGVMRSIADGDRQKAKVSAVRRPASIYGRDGVLAIDRPTEAPSPEEAYAEDEELARVREGITQLFPDDFPAQMLIEGIMDGIEGEELRALTELDPTAYASKRKLIGRRLAKLKAREGLS
jgi:RNA polymerase sigma-70 factor (ECF subfamily)